MFGLILGLITSFCVSRNDSIGLKPTKPFVWKFYPLLYYTTETNGVAEIFSYVQFKLKDAKRSSNVRFVANYSQEKQYTLLIPFQVCFKQDRYFAQGKVELTHYPEYFYGIGNGTKESIRELYSFESANVQLAFYKQVRRHFYLGLSGMGQTLKTHIETGGQVFSADCEIPGKNGYRYFLIGASMLYDSRDHLITTKRGLFIDFNLGLAHGILKDNSLFSYTPVKFDSRYFNSPVERATIAVRLIAEQALGFVPFRSMPTLGGPKLLRGYYYGRFRDTHLSALESELRLGPFKRFGFTVFGSLGKVGSAWDNLITDDWNGAYGLGVRYQLSKSDPANVRLDLGLNRDSYGVYLIFGEAF